jgi:hypothetical protein
MKLYAIYNPDADTRIRLTESEIPLSSPWVETTPEQVESWLNNQPSTPLVPTIENYIQYGEEFVLKYFNADRKVILLNKLLKAKENNNLANYPKLVAVYNWMEIIQTMAISGNIDFPSTPYTFEEVIIE